MASASTVEEEEITYANLQLDNPNEEDRSRIIRYLHQMQKRREPGLTKEQVIERLPCRICLKSGHLYNECPYKKSVEEGTKLGPGYTIICQCCGLENSHAGEKDVVRRAVRNRCSYCSDRGEGHLFIRCPKLKPKHWERIEENYRIQGGRTFIFGRRSRTRNIIYRGREVREQLTNLSLATSQK